MKLIYQQKLLVCLVALSVFCFNLNSMEFFNKVGSWLSSAPMTAHIRLNKGISECNEEDVRAALAQKPALNDETFSFRDEKNAVIFDNALNTALVWYKKYGQRMYPIIDLLLDAGADINRRGTLGTPLMVSVNTMYQHEEDIGEMCRFLIRYGANYEDVLFVDFLKDKTKAIPVGCSHYNLVRKEALECKDKKVGQSLLEFAISSKYAFIVKIFLLKGYLPSKRTISSIPQDIFSKQLKRVLLGYFRLVGPVGLYRKQNSSSGEIWIPDERFGPISKTGILTINAQIDNEIISLPEEVILKIVHHVIE